MNEIISQLKAEIMDAVAEEIPLNLVCPHCERDIDCYTILDVHSTYASDIKAWNNLTNRIVKLVSDSASDIMRQGLGI